jgi:hypothetical protein
MEFVADILSNPAVLAVLAALGVGVLDAVSAALMGTHPIIAKLLAKIANLIRTKAAGKPPLRPLALALCLLTICSADAQAGPIRDWVRARRSGGCSSCCQPAACAPQYLRPGGGGLAAWPAPGSCTNCTSCASGCACFGGGYYCCDGQCPVQFGPRPLSAFPVCQPPAVQSRPSCPGGVCPAPSPSRPLLLRR